MKEPFRFAPVTPGVVEELKAVLGEGGVSVDLEKIASYSHDEVAERFWDHPYRAEVLVFPRTTEEVAAVARLADEKRIPLTPRGAGTGLSGGAVPAFGGILVSFERMNRILEVDTDNLCMTVEPGVITSEITRAARKAGLLYAGDPCSGDASFIGGNVAENAGGNKVVKYGPTGSSVLALEVVLADGTVTWFGGKRRKDVTGYDFVHLMVGSEGTLGLITRVILKLLPLPAFGVDLLVPFPTVDAAIRFVPRIALEGRVVPASIELVDHHSLAQAEKFLNTSLPFDQAAAHLIIQLEGNDREVVADETERVGKLALEKGALEVFVADNRSSRDKLWKARKSVAEAIMAHYKNYAKEDLVVPTDRVPDLLEAVDALCRKWDMEAANYGHVGDGNIHVNLLMADDRPHWHDDMERAQLELYATVKELGGTLSGEHGIGLKRKAYLPRFLDAAQLDLMRRVKSAFDPNGILNPGKLVLWEGEEDS